jgi:hypothetical protein
VSELSIGHPVGIQRAGELVGVGKSPPSVLEVFCVVEKIISFSVKVNQGDDEWKKNNFLTKSY